MKKSLSVRLFLISAVFFSIMVSIIVVGLDIYFNRFYKFEKVDQTIEKMNAFANDYEKEQWSDEELYRQTDLFSSENNVVLSISRVYDELGEEGAHNENSDAFLVTIMDADETYYDFFLPSEESLEQAYAIGNNLYIEGYLQSNGLIDVTQLDDQQVETRLAASNRKSIIKKHATIVNIQESGLLPIVEGRERDEGGESAFESNQKEVIYEVKAIPHTSVEELTFSKVVRGENVTTTFFVTASLQPVQEVIQTIRKFIPYFFVFSILFSFVIAYVYSKLVAKPILSISQIADDMANMNFTNRIEINREDELGVLSTSLNILSNNLKNALERLTQANHQLELDYEREVKQEVARKEFIANASHELKTPLGILRSYAEGLSDGVNPMETDHYLECIVEEVENMDRLVHELLKLSKYDSMDIVLNKTPTDMFLLINDCIQSFEPALKDKEMRIQVSGDYGAGLIDRDKLYSAIQNLLSNAVKYGDIGTQIQIHGEAIDGKIQIIIENKCIPFTEEQLEKVWERFYKIDVSHSKRTVGTGLGLAIVKSIFDIHKIAYGVYNTKKGVRFWFTLDRAK